MRALQKVLAPTLFRQALWGKIHDMSISFGEQESKSIVNKVYDSIRTQIEPLGFERAVSEMRSLFVQRMKHHLSVLVSHQERGCGILHFPDHILQFNDNLPISKKSYKENPRFLNSISNIKERNIRCVIANNGDKFLPDEVLHNIWKESVAIDCGCSVELVLLQSICDVIGTERFNILFHKNSILGQKIRIHGGGSQDKVDASSLSFFTNPVLPCYQNDKLILPIGTRTIYNGVPFYRLKRPYGTGDTVHVLVMGVNHLSDCMYWSIDFTRALTEIEINQEMTEDYNHPRTKLECKAIARLGEPFLDEHCLQRATENTDKTLQECISVIMNQKFSTDFLRDQQNKQVITLDEAEQYGAGFAGPSYTDEVCYPLLVMIRDMKLEFLQSDRLELKIARLWCLLRLLYKNEKHK